MQQIQRSAEDFNTYSMGGERFTLTNMQQIQRSAEDFNLSEMNTDPPTCEAMQQIQRSAEDFNRCPRGAAGPPERPCSRPKDLLRISTAAARRALP